MATDRTNILCILKILEEYSDAEHMMTASDIIKKYQAQYDAKLDRRTVYSAIDSLNEIGYDISTFEENGKGYFLRERVFEPAEVKLLIDAAHSFAYISPNQTKELITKLRGLLNVYDRQKTNSAMIVNPNKKSLNQQVVLNTDILGEAISEKKKVSFIYMDYGYDKKLKPRRKEPYIVNPYGLICENEQYYLVCIYQGHEDPSLYRVDMMKDIEVLEADIDLSSKDANLDSVKKITYAHAGKPETIRLKCDKKALRYVIEKFGSDVKIIENKKGDGGFEAVFTASPEGITYWALQYLQHVEVLAPKSLRKAVIEAVKDNKYGV